MLMKRAFALVPAIACLVLAASATAAFGATGATTFRPRVDNALGLAPPLNYSGTEPSELGAFNPITYHGGSTMN